MYGQKITMGVKYEKSKINIIIVGDMLADIRDGFVFDGL
jgi:hypothetical protein